MRLVSFDPLRTLEIDAVTSIKPEAWLHHKAEIQAADWVLFPEYWQVNALVYAWHARIFPSVNAYHLGHDKVEMTRAFQAQFPSHTPHTLILPSTPASVERILDEFTFPFVAKEIRNSMGRGVHLVESRAALKQYAQANDVLYVQERLPIRRDLRVVVVGDEVALAYWREAIDGQFHNNVAQGGAVSFENVDPAGCALALDVARSLGVNHAGFDLAEVDGHWYLLEFNVRFGTQGFARRKINLGEIIVTYLRSQS